MKVLIVVACLIALVQVVSAHNTPKPPPALTCVSDDQCKLHSLPPTAKCSSGFCQCYNESSHKVINCTVSRDDITSPKPIGLIGRQCTLAVECTIENSFCNTSVRQCHCKHEYVSRPDNNKCLLSASEIGGKCEDTKQCLTIVNATCSQEQCICRPDFHRVNKTTCIKSIGLNETCTQTEECSHIDYAECNEKRVCTCSSASQLSDNGTECLPMARRSEVKCSSAGECLGSHGSSSECLHGHCQCSPGAHMEGNTCVASRKRLGDSCSNDRDCYGEKSADNLEGVMCKAGICACSEGFVQKMDKCVSGGIETIGRVSAGLMLTIISYFVLVSLQE